jgi:hypothetical protein
MNPMMGMNPCAEQMYAVQKKELEWEAEALEHDNTMPAASKQARMDYIKSRGEFLDTVHEMEKKSRGQFQGLMSGKDLASVSVFDNVQMPGPGGGMLASGSSKPGNEHSLSTDLDPEKQPGSQFGAKSTGGGTRMDDNVMMRGASSDRLPPAGGIDAGANTSGGSIQSIGGDLGISGVEAGKSVATDAVRGGASLNDRGITGIEAGQSGATQAVLGGSAIGSGSMSKDDRTAIGNYVNKTLGSDSPLNQRKDPTRP